MNRPVIFLSTDAIGGVWRYSTTLAAGLSARGWRCIVAVLGPPPDDEQRAALARSNGCTLLETDLPLEWTASDETQLAHAACALTALAHHHGAVTCHLHSPILAAFPWSMPVVAVAHSCAGTWWQAVEGTVPPPDFAWRMALMAQGLVRSDAVIAPTAAFGRALQAVYRTKRRIETVHNGLPAAEEGQSVRKDHVLAAGRLWDRGKNIAMLDQAAALLDTPVIAAGSYKDPNGGVFAASALRLAGNLAQDRVHAAMASAALFAAPSLYEPFGLAVLEAAQRATPLVLADIPAFRELWDTAAIFADPRNPGEWAAIMRRLIAEPEERAAWGNMAKHRAAHYSADRMVEATMAIHEAVMYETV